MIKNMSYKAIIPYGVGAKRAKHETSNTMKKPENGTAEISYDKIYTQGNLVSKSRVFVLIDTPITPHIWIHTMTLAVQVSN
jgi:hypothetical protein